MASTQKMIDDMEFRFDRRHYPGTTYTWVSVKGSDGQWHSLGDPWPCITPKRAELLVTSRFTLGRLADPTFAPDAADLDVLRSCYPALFPPAAE
jgi:hypothetical protein